MGYWLGVLAAAAVIGLVGAAMEVALLRRLYRSPELFQLLATFGVVLIVQDVTLALWGPEDLLGPLPPGLGGAVSVLGQKVPQYDLALIALGPIVLAGLYAALRHTRWGILVRAATADRQMVAALGVNQRVLFTTVVFLGAALAGLGGALQLAREPANLLMDLNVIAEAFVVVVVGGMGSLVGAYLAAVLIAVLQAFGILFLPEITLVLLFLVMAVVLVLRPWGLLGREETLVHGPAHDPGPPLSPGGRGFATTATALVLLLLSLPLWAGTYPVQVATEIAIMALFAISLHFLMGIGGMISFGHAAYLGLGAYGAALLVRHLEAPMGAALIAAPVAGGLGALAFGWFCVRLSGVYLAMLTLAFAQIAWAVAFQWYDVTGGDNGLLGIWPDDWAASPEVYYLLALSACTGAILLLRRMVFSPFGFVLRAARDNPARAEAIGIHVRRVRWVAFGIAGAAAGLAGGLFAFLKGSVFPTMMSIPVSVDGLVMVLLGGVQTLLGPVVGAGVFTGLQIHVASETDFWRVILGAAIVAAVLVFPRGLGGFVRDRWTHEPPVRP